MNNALVPIEPTVLAAPEVVTPDGDMLSSPHAFRNALDMANVLSRSQLVPQHFRGKPEDVLAGILLARTMGENVLMVLQNVHFVSGKPGFAAPFLIALANKSGVFDGGLRFVTSGQGADLAVTCWAIVRATGERVERTVSLAMARADGWVKNSKYASLPEQMLSYRAATFLIRLYAPGILLGYRPTDELEDIEAARSHPEPASSPPRVSRAAPFSPAGGEAVTSAGSSAPSPGPEKVAGTSPPPKLSPGPGDSSERAGLEERVKELQKQHGALVKEKASVLGLPSVKKSTSDQLVALIDAVTEHLKREAVQDEGTRPEGAQP